MARSSLSPVCLLLSLLVAIFHVEATIFVPEEIPSLLSVVYSNLPPIKKGTDSRLGVGFRLGPNADVQFQLELGPGTYTKPIGSEETNPAAAAAAKKRHAAAAASSSGTQNGDGAGSSVLKDWLNAWRTQLNKGGSGGDDGGSYAMTTDGGDPSVGGGISDAVTHLRQLYKPQPMPTETR